MTQVMTQVDAIDVHAHYGDYFRDQVSPWLNRWASAPAEAVAATAQAVGVRLTIVSPLSGLMPRGQADAVRGNADAARIVPGIASLRQWAILHPAQAETFEQTEQLLIAPHCVGIKLHPEEHVYPIREQGDRIFEFAARHDALVLTHSGDPNSWPEDFVPFANQYPNVRLILAHLGNGGGAAGDPTLQVRAIQDCKHGNVYVDTSSARSILPGLIEWAVAELGSERILFGTDSPLYSTAMQRSRIDHAGISDDQKADILYRNAQRLIGPKVSTPALSH